MTIVSDKDLLIMKMLHYFIINKNYSPVIIKGIEDEIWLENKKDEYTIIRIVTRHIHNNEQFKFDNLKTKHIAKQIKRKLIDPSMNILSIYTDMEYVDDVSSLDEKNFINILITAEEELIKNEIINKNYSDIKENLNFEEKDFELIGKITRDISEKNMIETEKREKFMKNTKTIITYLLIIINALIFALMYIYGNGSENAETLIKFGAIKKDLVLSGEYIRLITSAFLHIGVSHLIFNMYALYISGSQIEYIYGKVKYIIIYLFSAIMGSLFTVALSGDNVISAGASGAIFGLFGSLLYFGYNYRGYIGNSLVSQIVPVILINLFIGFTNPNIGNAAHIGGLIGGYLISMAIGANIDESKKDKINGFILTIILTAFMIYMGFIR